MKCDCPKCGPGYPLIWQPGVRLYWCRHCSRKFSRKEMHYVEGGKE